MTESGTGRLVRSKGRPRLGFLAAMLLSTLEVLGQSVLLEERFDDANLASRGWYDGTAVRLSAVEHIPGSAKSAEFHWRRGARTPESGGAIRRKFTPSEAVQVSYWVKYSTNYTGSNKPYHPHEFLLLTTRNGDWDGPAFTHLTGYIEQNEGTPVLAIQDGQNIDESRVGQDLSAITENRAVAGCNGVHSDGHASVDCYRVGTGHWNGKIWKAAQPYFREAQGAYYQGDWHHVAAYFKLNSIVGGKGVADGELRYWYDGIPVIEHTNVMMRTGANPTMKWNQFQIAPYIGDGSPVDQSMWVDDLRITDSRLLADGDEDGMPDAWEASHALDPSDAGDAALDPDGDQFGNLAEYLAGTDPRSPASVLRIRRVSLIRADSWISFDSVPGRRYEIQRMEDLTNGTWSTVSNGISGNGGVLEIVDPGGASVPFRFYRAKL